MSANDGIGAASSDDIGGGTLSRTVRGFSPAAFRAARERAGRSLTALADETGVSETAIGQWERGISHPTAKRLKAVADALAVQVEDLLRPTTEVLTLADLRTRQGLTTRTLAERTGLSVSVLSRVENGRGPTLSARTAQVLARFYSLDEDVIEAAWLAAKTARRGR